MPQEIRSAADTHLDFLKDFADRLTRREIDLPPFPDVHARILATLDDPDLSMDRLARVVTAAPDLCVQILLMANSALLNRAGVEVTDIAVAVSRLGASAVRNAAVALATRKIFDVPKGSPLQQKLDELRTDAVTTAAYAYAMAGRSGLGRLRDNAMLTGLLHNVGSIYLLSRSDQYPELAAEEVMQNWAPGIGYAILENWGFPEEIAKAVEEQNQLEANHFAPPGLHDLLIVGKWLASHAAREEKTPSPESMAIFQQTHAFGKLDVHKDNLEPLLEEIGAEVESFVTALK